MTEKQQLKTTLSPGVVRFGFAIFASAVAETATFPLDITRARLQIQGELVSKGSVAERAAYRGAIQTMTGIVREEGFTALFRGLSPAVIRHAVYTGARMNIYEYLRSALSDGKNPLSLWQTMVLSMSSGAIGQFLASPTDLVKTQMQLEGKRLLQGNPPRFNGVGGAFMNVYREAGLRGMWRGSIPNMQRAALVNMGDFTAYEYTKRNLLAHTNFGDTTATHAIASLTSSLSAAILGTPADVVKTRMMNQPFVSGKPTLYRSSLDCLQQAIRTEGFLSLYKGFVPIWCRMAPWSMTFWIVNEKARSLMGMEGF